MRSTHCVIREFPSGSTFMETWGTKAYCMSFARKAAKPGLKVCKFVSVASWDKHGKPRKENRRCRVTDPNQTR